MIYVYGSNFIKVAEIVFPFLSLSIYRSYLPVIACRQ